MKSKNPKTYRHAIELPAMPQDNYLTDPFTEVYGVSPAVAPLTLIETVLEQSFSLPHKAIQAPVIAAALTLKSRYCSIIPLITSYGPSGTGKSQLGKLAAGLNQLPSNFLLAGKTTPTAIRNLIQLQKFGEDWQDSDCSDEDDSLIIWDDINPDVLRDPTLLSILKSGYSRKTANIAIANAGGTNLYFNCFAVKFTSTIHPFWAYQEFGELARRILILPHRPYDEFDGDDLLVNKEPSDLIDLDYINFDGYREMKTFIPDQMELLEIRKIRIGLKHRLKNANFTNDFGKLCFDLMTFGTLWGVFANAADAIAKLEAFYQLQKECLNEKTEFDYWLDRYLEDFISESCQLLQVKLGLEPIVLPRKALQMAIDAAIKASEIPNSRYDLASVMRSRGWKLHGSTKNIFEKPAPRHLLENNQNV